MCKNVVYLMKYIEFYLIVMLYMDGYDSILVILCDFFFFMVVIGC